MGGTGLEQSALTPSKTTISLNDSTKSGTLKDQIDPDLAFVVEHWPELPEHVKQAIKSLIEMNTQSIIQETEKK